MRTRNLHRSVRLAAMLVTLVAGLVVSAGPASAHQVTSINADCYLVTAHFSDFPESGVVVHMAATVNELPPVTRDVLVTSDTTEATLDISATTANLYGTLTIQADITWRLYGWQHVHQTLTATCASPTTTTTTTQPTTTTAPATTTTLGGQGTTVPTTGRPTTTTEAAVSPVSTTPTSGVSPVSNTSTLPRTGSDATFPALFGSGLLVAGALALRRRRSWTS